MREYIDLNPNKDESRFLYDIYSAKWGNRFFEMRPAFSMNMFSGNVISETMQINDHDSIVSVPLYAKMSGISVSEVKYESLSIQLYP